jgi:hypothetical protein
MLPLLVTVFVEGIRLLFSVGPMSNDIARKVLSIVLALIDFLKGEWKHALLSFAGYYGQYPLVIGIILKVFIDILTTIAPDISERLEFDIYRTGKSLIIGIVLWIFTTFAPDFARAAALRAFDAITAKIDALGLKRIKGAIGVAAAKKGQKFNPDETEAFRITFEEIQNLQTIIRQPHIMCSKEFQAAINPSPPLAMPALLLLEMMNIATDPDSVNMECGTMAGMPLKDTVESGITGNPPTAIMNPGAAEASAAAAATAVAEAAAVATSVGLVPPALQPAATGPPAATGIPATPNKPKAPVPAGPLATTPAKLKAKKGGGKTASKRARRNLTKRLNR